MQTKWLARLLGVALLAGTTTAVGATTASASATITGSGSTLVQPLEGEWASAYDAANSTITVTYNGDGSTDGYDAVANGLDAFGASDAPLSVYSSPSCSGCLQMPWALSATGIGFHINGLKKLRLTGQVIAQIYLGQIKNWDAHAIQKLQPRGVHLPNLAITPFWREDGSGDTYAFTKYESKVDGTFNSKIGSGTSVNWPTGDGAKKNSGMVSALQGTNGSIAYVAVSYLIADWPRAAAVKNAAGNYESPNYNNIANAAQSITSVPGNNQVTIVDPGKRYKIAYPVSTFTYVIVPSNSPEGPLLKAFIHYCITTGQAFGPRLGFVPIPASVKNADESTLNQVH
jgi:phosphate transport system substrate-binding protein